MVKFWPQWNGNGFYQKYHCSQWFSNGFFTCETLVSMVVQWFFRSQPLVSMIFPMVFYNRTIAIEWMVCGSPLTLMIYRWFLGSKRWFPKKLNKLFFQQKHRGKQNLDTHLDGPMLQKCLLGIILVQYWICDYHVCNI